MRSYFPGKNMNRREFIKKSTWLLTALNLLPFLSWKSGKTEAAEGSTVGVIKGFDRGRAVDRAFKLMSFPNVEGDRVLIKPNFNTADPAPGSTHNDTLVRIIEYLQEKGAKEIIIGERSGPPDTEEVMREKGIFELAEEKGVKVVNFDKLNEGELIHFQREDLTWENGFHFPRILQEVDHIIGAGCLKTHQFGGQFTMALKLAVGIIPNVGTTYMRELHGSERMRDKIAEINLAYKPDLYIIDGVEAFTTGGPSSGTRVKAGITLVGSDPVAVDAVGVAVLKELGSTDIIMNTPVFELEQLARAVELGLGVSSSDRISLTTDDSEGKEYLNKIRKHF